MDIFQRTFFFCLENWDPVPNNFAMKSPLIPSLILFPRLSSRLQQLHSLNLLEPIHCISVVLDHHSKVCTHLLVGLANGKLIIVSVKDTVAQQSRTN